MADNPMTHPSPEAVAKAMDYAVVVARDMKRRAARGTHPDMPSETCIDTLAAHVAALTAQLEAERAARTCNGNLQVQDATAFLEEASRYFENRPTHGEDRAHWSNVHNAENCRKVISTLTREKDRADAAVAEAKALREAVKSADALLGRILKHGEIAVLDVGSPFATYGGKKPPNKEMWAVPRHMHAEIEELRATLAQSRSDSECDLPAADGGAT